MCTVDKQVNRMKGVVFLSATGVRPLHQLKVLSILHTTVPRVPPAQHMPWMDRAQLTMHVSHHLRDVILSKIMNSGLQLVPHKCQNLIFVHTYIRMYTEPLTSAHASTQATG